MIVDWVASLLRRRSGHVFGVVAGVAVAVSLLASIGAFIASAQSTMTSRAASNVAVDWQVKVTPGSDPTRVLRTVAAADGTAITQSVRYAAVTGFAASVGGTLQRTGEGVVLGVPFGYGRNFPGEIRLLTGTLDGVVVAQQTAANLHLSPGDRVSISASGIRPIAVTVTGIVDLPQANSLFQEVGSPASAQPSAPPDNVLLMPSATFSHSFSGLESARPADVTTQIHTRLSRHLPNDPAAAYIAVTGAANNLEVGLAGTGVVGDNLAASLDAARSDAAYARLLFLFLGLPGAVLAALLTIAVAGANASARRRDQALLRTRGASVRQIATLATAEAGAVGVAGAMIGLALAAAISGLVFGVVPFTSGLGLTISWALGAALVGIMIAIVAVAVPAIHDARSLSVTSARRRMPGRQSRWWSRIGLDLILVASGFAVFVLTTQSGYTLVLAPEGVATINVNYVAFLGPALVWIGAGLLSWRLIRMLLSRRRIISAFARPFTGRLASTVAASFARQGNLLAVSAVLLGLTLAFAGSTAIFNNTYQQQAEVDARLTNGADVRVTVPVGSMTGASVSALARVPGVAHVETMQHRFAYVGNDLQDLFGVHASTISAATSLQDAYFRGGTAKQLMARLKSTPDGILVSAETVTDYQLALGDHVSLRLVDQMTQRPRTVTFRYIGVALEFPTAPKDSFLVANAAYVARQTGSSAAGTFLIATDGTPPRTVASAIRSRLGPGVAVTPIGVTRSGVGSSLTSVDLAGLTKLELGFALVLGAASGGLVLALRLRDRRTTFAIAGLMGATRRQLRGFVLAEGGLVASAGILIGVVVGGVEAAMLVAVLTGVFDPAPASLAIPWPYLIAVTLFTIAAVIASALAVARRSGRPAIESLREG